MKFPWSLRTDDDGVAARSRDADRGPRDSQYDDVDRAPRRGRTEDRRLDLLGQLSEAVQQLAQLPDQFGRVLTYQDVIAWFVEERPTDDVATAGAVLRLSRGSRRSEIYQVFLDRYNEPLRTTGGQFLGRRVVGAVLDEELADTFGDDDLFIVN